ncbi:MAG: heavy metal translocating P-type ATPase [Johnsonella sp.]|nr:heavy metal translocating P-type ATPase [Johnsonella sp.]
MNKKQKNMLRGILLSSAFFLIAVFFKRSALLPKAEISGRMMQMDALLAVAFFFAAYLFVGLPVLKKAVYNIGRGKLFDENFLMCIATIGAFGLRDFAEGVIVMLFYTIGEFFQSMAVDKSRRSIGELMDIRPDYANLREESGELRVVDPYEVQIGEIIVVKPGEKIPLDGVVIKGASMLDMVALTGESLPRAAEEGDTVLSGSINMEGVLDIRVVKEFSESTASRILDLVENASTKKSSSENFITKFARVYTPIVVGLALLIVLLGPLFFSPRSFGVWLERSLTFLVVSCPCALVLSVPLSFFGGVGASSKLGILVKGSNYLEALAKTKIAVFDKTGTLTEGVFALTKILPRGMESESLLEIAAYAEHYSSHPIALSIKKSYEEESKKKEIESGRIRNLKEISGRGIYIELDGIPVLVGNARLMEEHGIPYAETKAEGSIVHIAQNGEYRGCLVIADRIKKDAGYAISGLRELGVRQTVMLTGDSEMFASEVAKTLCIDEVYAKLLPGDKLDKVEELVGRKKDQEKLIFVGDGINDAPVLARADVGVAMGGLGSDAAIEAADIVIMNDEPSRLLAGIELARRTVSIANQNIVFALGIKIAVLILAFFGLTNMWTAVFADVGVAVIAILNAMRNLDTASLRYVAK